jgi:hypothetical protein
MLPDAPGRGAAYESLDVEVEVEDADSFGVALAASVAGFGPSLSVGAGLR